MVSRTMVDSDLGIYILLFKNQQTKESSKKITKGRIREFVEDDKTNKVGNIYISKSRNKSRSLRISLLQKKNL